jgi:hypothetical protein
MLQLNARENSSPGEVPGETEKAWEKSGGVNVAGKRHGWWLRSWRSFHHSARPVLNILQVVRVLPDSLQLPPPPYMASDPSGCQNPKTLPFVVLGHGLGMIALS